MPGELIMIALVEVVGGLVASVGAQAANSKWRTFFDRREFEQLGDDAKQAFIAGLVFVAAHDGALSRAELDEIDSRLQNLDVSQKGRDTALALAAREEVAAVAGGDDADFAGRVVARLPEGRVREALLRVSVSVALWGDLERQLAAVRLLGKAMGLDEKAIETTVNEERGRLVR
jgi:hypothetical protein